MSLIDIIIPTYNNHNQLIQCLNSINLGTFGPMRRLIRFIIVNNGHECLKDVIKEGKQTIIIQSDSNLGWEGGLKMGLSVSDSPLVCFSNDDIKFVEGQKDSLWRMSSLFNDPAIGAVGPCSNFVMGPQSIFYDHEHKLLETKYLIGFFMMLRREALEEAGGVDDELPGGDDIDLSIRLRDSGYRLICRRDIFVFHHGEQTGRRLHEGYWNSPKMQEETNLALIRKHGMLKFWKTMVMGNYEVNGFSQISFSSSDIEGEICRSHVRGDKVVEMGCGGVKTHENSLAIDLFEAGEEVPFVAEGTKRCVSDMSADVSRSLPIEDESQDTIIARHILEHVQDPLGTLSIWNKLLKNGGRLIIAVPNNGLGNTILMNPEHVNSFVPSSLRRIACCAGFKEMKVHEEVNGTSFVSVFVKDSLPLSCEDPEKTVSPIGSRKDLICSE